MKPYYKDEFVTIYNRFCEELIPSLGRFDLLLTDPPYGIGESSNRVMSRGNNKIGVTDYGFFDWDKQPPKKETIDGAIAACKNAIIWGGNYFHLPPRRGWLVWDKQNTGDFADAELAWTNLETAVRIMHHMWNGMIRKGEASREKRVHPTQKPVELMRWCIGLADGAYTILDPYAGSGTTGRAAKDLRKQCVLIERDERYCEIAAKRMAQEVLAL